MVYKPTSVNFPHISDVLPCIPRRIVARRRSNYLILLSIFACCYIVSQPLHYRNHKAITAEEILFGCPRLANFKVDKEFTRVGIVASARTEFDKVILDIVSKSHALYFIAPNGRMTPTLQRDLYTWSANDSRSFDVALGSSRCSVKEFQEVIQKRELQTFYVFYDHKDFPKYKDTSSVLDDLGCFINVLDALKEREVEKALSKRNSAFIPVHVVLKLDMISRYHTLLFEKLNTEMRGHFDNITMFSLGKGHCKADFQFRNDYEAYFYSIYTIAKVFRETYGLDVTIIPVY